MPDPAPDSPTYPLALTAEQQLTVFWRLDAIVRGLDLVADGPTAGERLECWGKLAAAHESSTTGIVTRAFADHAANISAPDDQRPR